MWPSKRTVPHQTTPTSNSSTNWSHVWNMRKQASRFFFYFKLTGKKRKVHLHVVHHARKCHRKLFISMTWTLANGSVWEADGELFLPFFFVSFLQRKKCEKPFHVKLTTEANLAEPAKMSRELHSQQQQQQQKDVSFSPESKKGSKRGKRRLTALSPWFLQLFPLSHGRPSFIISLDLCKRSVVAQSRGYHCSSYWNNSASVTVRLIHHHRNARGVEPLVEQKNNPEPNLKTLKLTFTTLVYIYCPTFLTLF